MNAVEPPEFIRTLYLGDRACKAIHIENWKEQVALEVDLLSRIRSPNGIWNFYAAEDIPDARIVFTGVESIEFHPPGFIPNDFINGLLVKPAQADVHDGRWIFEVSISSGSSDGSNTEVTLRITAAGIHLEDPARPGVQIRT